MNESTNRRASVGTRRIRRASDKQRIIELLTSDSASAFKEIWRLLLFAALVGFRNQRREPLVSVESGEGIRQDVFANNPVWPGILYLIGLVELNGIDALKATEDSEEERIGIFEEYANGGLAILQKELETTSGSLDGLLTFIQSHTAEIQTKKPDLQISI